MTLPLVAKITSIVFPAAAPHALCGIALGDSFAALALPEWWKDSHSDGRVRYGWYEVGEGGVAQLVCSVTNTLGRVSHVDVSFEIANDNGDGEQNEASVFAALHQELTARLGGKGAKAKKSVTWEQVKGPHFEGTVSLRISSFHMDFDRVYRVELALDLAHGQEITAGKRELFIDVDALAKLLATSAHPARENIDVLARFFSKETAWLADQSDAKAYRAMLDAFRLERATDIPATLDAICALIDWSEADKGRENARINYVLRDLASLSFNNSHTRAPLRTGAWLALNPLDVVYLVKHAALPVPARAAFAAQLMRALEWGDATAMDAARAVLRTRAIPGHEYLVWDSTPEIEARAFDLFTCALPDNDDDARVRRCLVGAMYSSSRARACVCYFELVRGKARAPVNVDANDGASAHAWAESCAMVKTHFPHLVDEVCVQLFDNLLKHAPMEKRAAFTALADHVNHVDVGAKSTWTIGARQITHSGKPNAGRWSMSEVKAKAKAPRRATKKSAAKPIGPSA